MTHGYSIDLIIKVTVKNKTNLICSKKERFFKSFFSDVRLGLLLKTRFIAISMVSWREILVKTLIIS